MRNRALPYAWAFAVLALVALAACGGGGNGPTDPGQGGPPPNPTIEISPSSGLVARMTFTVSGRGFTVGGTVTLHIVYPGFGDLTAHFGLNPSTPGAFSSNMSSTIIGEHTMWAVDDASGRKSNEVKFTVAPAPAS